VFQYDLVFVLAFTHLESPVPREAHLRGTGADSRHDNWATDLEPVRGGPFFGGIPPELPPISWRLAVRGIGQG